ALLIQCKVPAKFNVEITGEFPTLLMDKIGAYQIFQNLINNAVSFNDKDQAEILIHSELNNEFWEISVKDNGVGIPEKELDKIFDLFISKPMNNGNQSSGIGLSMVKRTITIYGGTISVKSEIGKGTEFIVRLPKSLEVL